MATWDEFARAEPDMAAFGERSWRDVVALDRGEVPAWRRFRFEIAFLATTRSDGSARVHPFCPFLVDGRLSAAIPRHSPKGDDLRRDPRCAVHALPGPDDDELCIRARAIEVSDDPVRRARAVARLTASGVAGMAASGARDALFELDIEQVDVAVWRNVGAADTYAERQRWRARANVSRRDP